MLFRSFLNFKKHDLSQISTLKFVLKSIFLPLVCVFVSQKKKIKKETKFLNSFKTISINNNNNNYYYYYYLTSNNNYQKINDMTTIFLQ